MSYTIRKQVYELSADDFIRFPVWEFALDEEGKTDQDEATVRPYRCCGEIDARGGMFVVRASFELADGSPMKGYLTPPLLGARDDLGVLQPVITAPQGQVPFWYGVVKLEPEELSANYRLLNRQSAQGVFPVQFVSDVPLVGGPVRSEVPGFATLQSTDMGAIVEGAYAKSVKFVV